MVKKYLVLVRYSRRKGLDPSCEVVQERLSGNLINNGYWSFPCIFLIISSKVTPVVGERALRPRAHTSAAEDILCAAKIAQGPFWLLPFSGCKPRLEPESMPWSSMSL